MHETVRRIARTTARRFARLAILAVVVLRAGAQSEDPYRFVPAGWAVVIECDGQELLVERFAETQLGKLLQEFARGERDIAPENLVPNLFSGTAVDQELAERWRIVTATHRGRVVFAYGFDAEGGAPWFSLRFASDRQTNLSGMLDAYRDWSAAQDRAVTQHDIAGVPVYFAADSTERTDVVVLEDGAFSWLRWHGRDPVEAMEEVIDGLGSSGYVPQLERAIGIRADLARWPAVSALANRLGLQAVDAGIESDGTTLQVDAQLSFGDVGQPFFDALQVDAEEMAALAGLVPRSQQRWLLGSAEGSTAAKLVEVVLGSAYLDSEVLARLKMMLNQPDWLAAVGDAVLVIDDTDDHGRGFGSIDGYCFVWRLRARESAARALDAAFSGPGPLVRVPATEQNSTESWLFTWMPGIEVSVTDEDVCIAFGPRGQAVAKQVEGVRQLRDVRPWRKFAGSTDARLSRVRAERSDAVMVMVPGIESNAIRRLWARLPSVLDSPFVGFARTLLGSMLRYAEFEFLPIVASGAVSKRRYVMRGIW